MAKKRKSLGNIKQCIKKFVVARLKSTRDDNSKGPRIGPSLFYTSKLYNKYIKKSKFENRKAHQKETHSIEWVFIYSIIILLSTVPSS